MPSIVCGGWPPRARIRPRRGCTWRWRRAARARWTPTSAAYGSSSPRFPAVRSAEEALNASGDVTGGRRRRCRRGRGLRPDGDGVSRRALRRAGGLEGRLVGLPAGQRWPTPCGSSRPAPRTSRAPTTGRRGCTGARARTISSATPPAPPSPLHAGRHRLSEQLLRPARAGGASKQRTEAAVDALGSAAAPAAPPPTQPQIALLLSLGLYASWRWPRCSTRAGMWGDSPALHRHDGAGPAPGRAAAARHQRHEARLPAVHRRRRRERCRRRCCGCSSRSTTGRCWRPSRAQHGLDQYLVAALAAQESTFDAGDPVVGQGHRPDADHAGDRPQLRASGSASARSAPAGSPSPTVNAAHRHPVLRRSGRPVRRRALRAGRLQRRRDTASNAGAPNGPGCPRTSGSTTSRSPRRRTTSSGSSAPPRTIAGCTAAACSRRSAPAPRCRRCPARAAPPPARPAARKPAARRRSYPLAGLLDHPIDARLVVAVLAGQPRHAVDGVDGRLGRSRSTSGSRCSTTCVTPSWRDQPSGRRRPGSGSASWCGREVGRGGKAAVAGDDRMEVHRLRQQVRRIEVELGRRGRAGTRAARRRGWPASLV